MNCRNCGRYIPDNSRFCPGCGTTVQATQQNPVNPQQPVYQAAPQQPVYQAAPQQPVYQAVPQQPVYQTNPQQPVYQTNPQQPVYQVPAQQNPAPQPLDLPDSPRLVALKKLARSPMMLIATIACTLGVLGGALVSVFMIDIINELSTFWVSIGEEVVTFDMSSVAGAIAGVIPSALICLGLWITYGSARKERGMSTAGLMIIKVLNIIALVGMCVSAGLFLLGFGIGAFVGYMESPNPEALVALLVVGGVFVAIFAFAIILQARTIGSLNAAIGIINNGRTAKKVSVFLAVILIMGAVGNALSGLGLMSISGMLPEIERLLQQVPQLEIPAGTLSGLNETFLVLGIPYLISAVSGFMFALLIFSYKANVQNLIVAPTPVEAREIYPYAPAPAPVVKETPAEEPDAEEAPAEEPAAEEVSAEEPAAEEVPAEEPAAEETPAEEPAAEETPAEEPAAEEAPAEEPAEEPAAEEAPAEEPAEEPAAEETPAEAPAAEEALAEEPAAEEISAAESAIEVPAPVVVAEEVPAFIFCTECGQKLVATAKFCSRCGHPQK